MEFLQLVDLLGASIAGAGVNLILLNDFFSWPSAIKFLQLIDLQGASIAGAGLVPFGLTQKEPKGQGLFSLSSGLH